MSRRIGIDTLRLKATDRLAHTEYCTNPALVRAVTGLDPDTNPEAWRAFADAWDFDLLWATNDGPVPWSSRGRTTSMGHAEFLEGGVDKNTNIACPFHDVEEVFSFDAVEEFGLPDMAGLISSYEESYKAAQAENPNQIYTGGYYKTLISGAIDIFGWDMLLMAASDADRFERVLEGIYQQSLQHFKAQAQTSIEVFICHDDMVWTEGAFMHPEFYRRSIFPRYKKLWSVLHEAGKIVLFCSDGNYTEFADDIADAGADGFIFEPLTDLDYVAGKYGRTHAIVGSKVDCRTLTFGNKEQIEREIDETLAIAMDCPGFIFAVGNHIPSNVPVDNGLFYFEYLTSNWRR
jgi:hypothetical protein